GLVAIAARFDTSPKRKRGKSLACLRFGLVSILPAGSIPVEQGRLQRLPPCPGPWVVGPEAGAEFPVGPAKPQPLRLPGDEPGPARPGGHVRGLVRPELPEEYRTVVLLRPRRRLPEVLADRGLFGVAAGPLPALPPVRPLGPRGALVGERERVVV